MIEKIYKNKYMATCDNCGTGQECDSWADVMDFMYDFQNKILDKWLVETGLLDKETVQKLKERYKYYVPFYRNIKGARKNEEGWKKRLVDGEFKHYCPECQEELR